MDSSNIQTIFERSLSQTSIKNATVIRPVLAKLPFDLLADLEQLYQADNSDDIAFEKIGISSGTGAWGVDAINSGRQLLQKYRQQLQKTICGNKILRKYCEEGKIVDDPSKENLILMAAIIAGGLLGNVFWNIDIVAVAFLGAKMVGNGLCKVEWQIT